MRPAQCTKYPRSVDNVFQIEATNGTKGIATNKGITTSNKKLLVTNASLLVTSALLVVTKGIATSNKDLS